MRKPISCVRPTYRTNPQSAWWNLIPPTTYLGQTNLCKSNANPYIITPCPEGCRCEGQPPKRVWKKAVRNWIGVIITPARWVWINQPARCKPVGIPQAPMSKY